MEMGINFREVGKRYSICCMGLRVIDSECGKYIIYWFFEVCF